MVKTITKQKTDKPPTHLKKYLRDKSLPFNCITRADLLWVAQTAIASKRYRDAVDCFDALVRLRPDQEYKGMNQKEQNLYVKACQSIMMSLRKSAFTLTSFQRDYLKLGLDKKSASVQEYKVTVISKAKKLCHRVQMTIDEEMAKSGAAAAANSAKIAARKGVVALPSSKPDKSEEHNPHELHISWSKMKADYYRYNAEMASELLLGDQPVAHADKCDTKALDLYNSAYKECKDILSPSNPVRLGVALNFAVFVYEVLLDQSKAAVMMNTAFELGIEALTDQKGDQYQHATLILEMMNDNLALWRELAEKDE